MSPASTSKLCIWSGQCHDGESRDQAIDRCCHALISSHASPGRSPALVLTLTRAGNTCAHVFCRPSTSFHLGSTQWSLRGTEVGRAHRGSQAGQADVEERNKCGHPESPARQRECGRRSSLISPSRRKSSSRALWPEFGHLSTEPAAPVTETDAGAQQGHIVGHIVFDSSFDQLAWTQGGKASVPPKSPLRTSRSLSQRFRASAGPCAGRGGGEMGIDGVGISTGVGSGAEEPKGMIGACGRGKADKGKDVGRRGKGEHAIPADPG